MRVFVSFFVCRFYGMVSANSTARKETFATLGFYIHSFFELLLQCFFVMFYFSLWFSVHCFTFLVNLEFTHRSYAVTCMNNFNICIYLTLTHYYNNRQSWCYLCILYITTRKKSLQLTKSFINNFPFSWENFENLRWTLSAYSSTRISSWYWIISWRSKPDPLNTIVRIPATMRLFRFKS